jgi:hypothetical protein
MGRNQFTGEYGIAKQEQLDKLHQHNAQKSKPVLSEQNKFLINNFLAILVPLLTVEVLRKALVLKAGKPSNSLVN